MARVEHVTSARSPARAGGHIRTVYRCDESAGATPERDTLPAPRPSVEARVFQSLTVSAVRALVARHAAEAGLDPARTGDLVLAVNEIATNSVKHAGGWGVLRLWREAGVVVCEVRDRGCGDWSLPAVRDPTPDATGGYGLRLADRLCERVDARSSRGGTVVRLEMAL